MARYQIIDEPRSKPWAERIIIEPTLILFAAILVPLIWNPPLFGRFWMPLLWLLANGYALGSSTLGKEVATSLVGILALYGIFILASFVMRNGVLGLANEDIFPYLRLVLFGVFFWTMYLIVMRQSVSYQLYKYSLGDSS